VQDHLHLHQFSARCSCRACRFSHHFDSFVVVIFSLRMYAQQVFSALFTGVLNTIACVCTRGVSGVFPAVCGWRLFQERGSRWAMEVSPHFLQGVDVYVLCVCTHIHTHCMWDTRM